MHGKWLTSRPFEVSDARVGDTIIEAGTENEVEALPGYTEASESGRLDFRGGWVDLRGGNPFRVADPSGDPS